MKTAFPEKKCMGVVCCDEELDENKNQTG